MNKIFKALYPTIVLAAICLVVALALSSADMVTKEKISALETQKATDAMKRVMPADDYTKKTIEDNEYHEVSDERGIIGYIFVTSANGYGGKVQVMTAVNADGTVKAVEILDVSGETPGLGQNARQESFYSQFAGKSGELTVVKSGATTDSSIQAITGATITSKGVTAAVNEALDMYKKITEEGKLDEE